MKINTAAKIVCYWTGMFASKQITPLCYLCFKMKLRVNPSIYRDKKSIREKTERGTGFANGYEGNIEQITRRTKFRVIICEVKFYESN